MDGVRLSWGRRGAASPSVAVVVAARGAVVGVVVSMAMAGGAVVGGGVLGLEAEFGGLRRCFGGFVFCGVVAVDAGGRSRGGFG